MHPPYEPRDDASIKEIALGIVNGQIFTSAHCKQEDIPMVFLALSLSGDDFMDWLGQNEIAVLYEHVDKASPRSVNGMPIFFSHHALSKGDWERVREKAKAIEQALEQV